MDVPVFYSAEEHGLCLMFVLFRFVFRPQVAYRVRRFVHGFNLHTQHGIR